MGRTFIGMTSIREVTIKGIEGDHLFVDIKVCNPYFERRIEIIDGEEKLVKRKNNGISENNPILLDISNANLLEKVNLLEEGDIVYLKYHIEEGVDSYNTEKWKLLDILDDIDMLELSNENCLFTQPIPERKSIIQPRRKGKNKTNSKEKKLSKKDKEIAELNEKVVVLEGENAQLKSQLQLLQDKNNMTIEEVQEVIGGDNDGTILL